MGDIKNKQNDPKNIPSPSGTLDNGNNPKGVASLKDSRNTQVSQAGTAYLRKQQMGDN